MHVAFHLGRSSLALAALWSLAVLALPANLRADGAGGDPEGLFMNLRPDAARGHQIIMHELMASTTMRIEDIGRLWNVWEPSAKAIAAEADHDERMRMTFERYGWVQRPGDEVPTLPLGYTPDGQGNIGSNCFSCHGGKVAGKAIPGAGNTHLDLTTMVTDIRNLRIHDRGGDYATLPDMQGPFQTPLSINAGFTNAVIFPAMIAGTQQPEVARQLIAHPELLLHHNMNPPPWWNFKKKERIYADAFAPKTPRQLMPFARSLTASDEEFQALESNFVHIYQYIEELQPPRYPFPIDAALAERGRKLFAQTCSACHGTYGDDPDFPNVVVPLEDVGTDPLRFRAVTKAQRERANQSWLQYDGAHPLTLESEGYLAQPLDGIWASAPYFHNGAAPTLWAVMNPGERPAVWKRTVDGYDQQRVGLEVEVLDAVPPGLSSRIERQYYDTSIPGNSAAGHDYPAELTTAEKWAVIEYLKTL